MLPNTLAIQALSAMEITWVALFKIDFTAGTERLCISSHDVDVDSETWSPSDITSASPSGPDNEPSRESYSLTFNDPVSPGRTRWIDRFTENGYVGIPLTVSLSFLVSNSWTDSLTVYKGTCISVTHGPGSGGLITNVEFAGPLAKLDDSSPLYISSNSQKGRLSTDTFLDEAHLAKDLQFGKLQ